MARAIAMAMARAITMAMAMAGLYFTFVELSVLNAWEIRDYVKAGAVITILTATVVGVARHIVNHRQVPTIPIFPKSGTPFPIIPAVLPAAARVRALGNDIDDALARSPIPSRNNSPLLWLPEIVA